VDTGHCSVAHCAVCQDVNTQKLANSAIISHFSCVVTCKCAFGYSDLLPPHLQGVFGLVWTYSWHIGSVFEVNSFTWANVCWITFHYRYIQYCEEESCCSQFNPLNTKLNPICHLLALFGAHHILHISR